MPSPEVNAEAVDTVRYGLRTFGTGGTVDSPAIALEATLLESEARSILGAVFDLSVDMFWESVYRAFQLGYLDVPFSLQAYNAKKLT